MSFDSHVKPSPSGIGRLGRGRVAAPVLEDGGGGDVFGAQAGVLGDLLIDDRLVVEAPQFVGDHAGGERADEHERPEVGEPDLLRGNRRDRRERGDDERDAPGRDGARQRRQAGRRPSRRLIADTPIGLTC